MAERAKLSADDVRARVSYDPETGQLTWKSNPPRGRCVGDALCTRDNGAGYTYTTIDRRHVAVHRVAFAVQTGRWPVEIDHVNGLRSDNRWSNLREASRGLNEANKALRSDSSSGFKGVSWHKANQRWRAHITHEGKHHSLGYHATAADAHAAYLRAAQDKFGEFARGA